MLLLSPFPLLPSGEVSCCHHRFATAVPLLPPLLQEIQRIFLLGYHCYLNLKRGFSCYHCYHCYLESGSSCYHCYHRYLKSGFSRYHCYFKFKSYRSSASLPLVPLLQYLV